MVFNATIKQYFSYIVVVSVIGGVEIYVLGFNTNGISIYAIVSLCFNPTICLTNTNGSCGSENKIFF